MTKPEPVLVSEDEQQEPETVVIYEQGQVQIKPKPWAVRP